MLEKENRLSEEAMNSTFETSKVALLAGVPTVPATPSHLTSTAVSPSQVNLTWQDNSTNPNSAWV